MPEQATLGTREGTPGGPGRRPRNDRYEPGEVVVELDGIVLKIPHPHELPAMLEVLRDAFDGWPHFELRSSALEHLTWKASNPHPNSLPVVIEDNGRVVGAITSITRHYRLHGSAVLVSDNGDVSLRKDYQGKGVMRALVKWSDENPLEGYALSVGYTHHPAFLHMRKQRTDSFPLANGSQQLALALDARRLARAEAERTGRPAPLLEAGIRAVTVASRLGALRPRRSSHAAVQLRAVDRFDARVAPFFERAAARFDFIQVRSEEYLNWRYADRRAGPFSITLAEDGDELLGYAVTKTSHGRGYLVDLLAVPGRLDVVDSLVDCSVEELRAQGAYAVLAWSHRRHPYRRIFRTRGFFVGRRGTGFAYRLREAGPEAARALSESRGAVHIMQGDTDWV